MRLVLVSIFLLMAVLVQAQDPKELEFNTLPCTSAGAIDSDGTTCTAEDVKKYERRVDKVRTKEEQKIQKLSKKKDPLKILKANKKRSKGIWVRSGTSN